MGRVWILCGCFFALLTVGLGAFATHALKPLINSEQLEILTTANYYIGFHAMALLALGLWSHWERWSSSLWAGNSFVIGTILFSGSLYCYVFTGFKLFAMITPFGGSLFLLGWILFIFSVLRTKNSII
jgi:uncharacterized membrane protein YgdD (TMEM256/DUF423 family)